MGVLNVTPDSFSDGGLFSTPESALLRAVALVTDGADIIDIGGESTRPATFHDGSPLSIGEELRRVIPAIELIAKELPDCQISIDTYKADVAEQALDAGATVINDVSGLTFDKRMAKIAALSACPVVIMHLPGQPRDISAPVYGDVVEEIGNFFRDQITFAISEGINESNIILDPGIGFGKNDEQNLAILRRLRELTRFGRPLLIGPSRKRFIGKILGNASPGERLEGTAAAAAIGIANGAAIVRVHDVKELAKVVKVSDAIVRG
jgi:dihydropteroate synthase